MACITIAEDDIHFTAKGAWRFFQDNRPGAFDLYLGGITWGNILPGNIVNDFSGTALYTIANPFYDSLLDIEPGKDFDRQLSGRGKFIVCNPMVMVQHNGYSDNSKQYIKFDALSEVYTLFKG